MNYIAERRLEEKDRRRNEILDAAETVCATGGIDSLTMDHVARQARLSRALLYVYFKDRTDLQFGLCERGLAVLGTRFEEAAARHGNGLDAVTAMGRAYLAFSKEFPVYFEAMSRFETHTTEPSADDGSTAGCLAAGARVHQAMIGAITAGQQDGSIDPRAGSPVLIALSLRGFMQGILQLVTSKDAVLSSFGLASSSLTDQALALARRSLAPR